MSFKLNRTAKHTYALLTDDDRNIGSVTIYENGGGYAYVTLPDEEKEMFIALSSMECKSDDNIIDAITTQILPVKKPMPTAKLLREMRNKRRQQCL